MGGGGVKGRGGEFWGGGVDGKEGILLGGWDGMGLGEVWITFFFFFF